MKAQFIFHESGTEKLDEVLALIRAVFLEFEAPDYSDEGIQEFMRFIKPETIGKMLSENKIRIWTCEREGRPVGALAASKDHIYLLFVSGQYHRLGIARRLFDMMVDCCRPPSITVNSSPYAVEAYRRLGFVNTGTEQTVNGLRFTPMKCML